MKRRVGCKRGPPTRHLLLTTLVAVLGFQPWPAPAQQIPDRGFEPPIGTPTFARDAGPRVAIDAAHVNFHTMDGGYATFARLLQLNGYRVGSNSSAFDAGISDSIDILVIANAMHPQSEDDFAPLPNLSAFTGEEIEAVVRWVAGGGALMLIADHMPIAGHNEALAAAFGVRFHNGFVFNPDGSGQITFRRSDGTLDDGGLRSGRDASARIDSVTAFTGQAFRLDPGVDGEPLLTVPPAHTLFLPSVAWTFSDSTPRIPADYLLQGALVRHGLGRVAVFGEAAMFSAQLAGPEERPMGMNHPAAAQNYAFALDVLRWLSEDSVDRRGGESAQSSRRTAWTSRVAVIIRSR